MFSDISIYDMSASDRECFISALFHAVFYADKNADYCCYALDESSLIEGALAFGTNNLIDGDGEGAFVTLYCDVSNLTWCRRHGIKSIDIDCAMTVYTDPDGFYPCSLWYVQNYFADWEELLIALHKSDVDVRIRWGELLPFLQSRSDYRSRALYTVFSENQILYGIDSHVVTRRVAKLNRDLLTCINDAKKRMTEKVA